MSRLAPTALLLIVIISNCSGQSSALNLSSSSILSYFEADVDGEHILNVNINNRNPETTPSVKWNGSNNGEPFSGDFQYSAKSTVTNILYLPVYSTIKPVADATVMMPSKKAFEEITYGKTSLKLNNETVSSFEVTGKEQLDIVIDGKKVKVEAYHLKAIENNQELWILNNSANPIVLKATGNYTLELTEVKL